MKVHLVPHCVSYTSHTDKRLSKEDGYGQCRCPHLAPLFSHRLASPSEMHHLHVGQAPWVIVTSMWCNDNSGWPLMNDELECQLRIETMCLNCSGICRLTSCGRGGKVHILRVDAQIADSVIDQAVYCPDRKIQTKWQQLHWYADALSKSSMNKDRGSPLLIPKMTASQTKTVV